MQRVGVEVMTKRTEAECNPQVRPGSSSYNTIKYMIDIYVRFTFDFMSLVNPYLSNKIRAVCFNLKSVLNVFTIPNLSVICVCISEIFQTFV